MKQSGIYSFVYKGKYAYVGQSIDLLNRIETHKRGIKSKKHPNLTFLDDYVIDDFIFNIESECDIEKLNEEEVRIYNLMSHKYIMINKVKCGMAALNGFNIIFRDDVDTTISFKNGTFYIGSFEISKKDNMFCLTDLKNFIIDNSNYNIDITGIMNTNEFRERVLSLLGISITKNKRKIVGELKSLGVYKTIGARTNRKVYCSYEVFITFLFASCPQFYASLCIYLVDNWMNNGKGNS